MQMAKSTCRNCALSSASVSITQQIVLKALSLYLLQPNTISDLSCASRLCIILRSELGLMKFKPNLFKIKLPLPPFFFLLSKMRDWWNVLKFSIRGV